MAPYLTTSDFAATAQYFTLLRCTHCGLLATWPQPDEKNISAYYQFSHYTSHTGIMPSRLMQNLYLMARKIAAKRKRKIIEKHAFGKNLLDVGCGTGHFLREMKNAGWRVAGVEPAEVARKQAEQSLEQTIYTRLQELPKQPFQVITMWHVLEHIHHPDQTLRTCRELLVGDGLLVVAVPNYQSYDAQHYNHYWAGYDVPRHLWHFTSRAMELLLAQNGFTLYQILPMPLDAWYVSLLSETYMNPQQPSWVRYLKAFTTGFKSNLAARKTGQYSSLLYLARKHAKS
jgi:2-polyprenyl-3-methyl-5-hydroxy-6-metoxy-1,4-benzoquinol methylase